MHQFSIIIPVLNESHILSNHQSFLKNLLEQGHEIIVVDGGSTDQSNSVAKKLGCKFIITKASRGHQLHTGAIASTHNVLVFLHADTSLPSTAIENIMQSFKNPYTDWGRFDVKLDNEKLIFKVIAWFMNKRSCFTGIVTGDHTIFVKRKTYFDCGGFADIPIMEDIDICKRLKKYSSPVCLTDSVITSSRKWEQQGIIKTVLLMWRLRTYYFFGVPAEKLAREYYS